MSSSFAPSLKPLKVTTFPAPAPMFDAPCQYSGCEWIGDCFACSGSEGPFYCETFPRGRSIPSFWAGRSSGKTPRIRFSPAASPPSRSR